MGIDYHFVDTYQMEIMQGRDLSEEIATDSEAILINETLAGHIGWEDPIGKTISLGTNSPIDLTIVGVVKNFHFRSLLQPVESLIMFSSSNFHTLAIRIKPSDIPRTIDFIKQSWQTFVPEKPFEFSFLDDSFQKYYESEGRLKDNLAAFTGLSIFISGLGLFGLAVYSTDQRAREVGIRKVLGASTGKIILILSSEIFRLVFFASIIAIPTSYIILSTWLEDFPYRIDLGVTTFILISMASLAVAWCTVAFQTLRAALANPTDILRYSTL